MRARRENQELTTAADGEKEKTWGKDGYGRLFSVVVSIILILEVFHAVKLYQMQGTLDSLMNNISQVNGQVADMGADISFQVKDAINEKSRILDNYRYEIGTIHKEERTVELHFYVTLKEWKNGVSTVTVSNDAFTAELRQNGENPGVFEGSALLSVFTEMSGSQVILTEGGVQKVQSLDWNHSLAEEILPFISASLSGSSSSSQSKSGLIEYEQKGTLHYSVGNTRSVDGNPDRADGSQLIACRVIALVDDKQVYEKKLELDQAMGDSEVAFKAKLKPGQTLSVYLDAEDQLGLHYRVQLESQSFDSDGSSTDESQSDYRSKIGIQTVTDAAGNVLMQRNE